MSAKEAEKRGLTPLAHIKSWAQAGVDPAGAIGIAGGVIILDVDNSAKAHIDQGARINQTTTSANQDVKVEAFGGLETTNAAGSCWRKL